MLEHASAKGSIKKKGEPGAAASGVHGTKSNNLEVGQTHHRFRVQFDLGYTGHPGKEMDGSSTTVPDQNLTVRQMLEQHTRMATGEVAVRKPVYFDIEIPQVRDITDVERYKATLERNLESVKQFIKEEQEAAKQAALDLKEKEPEAPTPEAE